MTTAVAQAPDIEAAFAPWLSDTDSLPDWFRQQRQSALTAFAECGFPSRRNEDWKYTPFDHLTGRPFQRPPELSAEQLADPAWLDWLPAALSERRLVFLNGVFAPRLSTFSGGEDDPSVTTLGDLLRGGGEWLAGFAEQAPESHAFVALAQALGTDGAVVRIPDGVEVTEPVEIVQVSASESDDTVVVPRAVVSVGAGSRLEVVERFLSVGGKAHLAIGLTNVVIGRDAHVEHCRIQMVDEMSTHIAAVLADIDGQARYTCHTVHLGGKTVRHDVHAKLTGQGGECTLNGLVLGDDRRHIDNQTTIHHLAPHCDSHELYKHILAGRSTGVFNGRIYVHPDAQKTDAKQSNSTLLLSPHAQMNSKPQLEIFADDVRCTHGATIGYLDAESLFYLRTRGIAEPLARRILTFAFANEVVDGIHVPALREALAETVLARLEEQSEL